MTSTASPAPAITWTPRPTHPPSNIESFVDWLRTTGRGDFNSYPELWAWSVEHLNEFWMAIWQYFDVRSDGTPVSAVSDTAMPGTEWFPDVGINFAEHALRRRGTETAIVECSQTRPDSTLSWDQLADAVGRARAGLERLGVQRGDRVASYMPNIVEAVVAFLATSSLGAIWTSCPPEFGTAAALDRLSQVEPKVLFAVDGYRYGTRAIARAEEVAQIRAGLPSLSAVVEVAYLDSDTEPASDVMSWDEFTSVPGPLEFVRVPFDHPLWIVYSSGTTGLPKPIVHGHGVLVEYLKSLSLHADLGPDDRFLWFTTTGWIMWNYLVSSLLVGTAIVLFDGDPGFPDTGELWRVAGRERVTSFGVGAGYLTACQRSGMHPGDIADLSAMRSIGSTGAPLPVDAYHWIADEFGPDVHLSSISGGTDVCGPLLGGNPMVPVHAGELSARCLGVRVESYDEHGVSVVGAVGELVITAPMPSMPVALWGDQSGERLRSSYFDKYDGVWSHGDWITITERGSAVISGRSDATLNRGGIRIGTSEVYRVVESVAGVDMSLIVHLEDPGHVGPGRLVLLVATEGDAELPSAQIAAALKAQLSPRHVPDEIHQVTSIPMTLSGKKMEVPVKRILLGEEPGSVASRDSMRNPAALDEIAVIAASSSRRS